MSIRGVEIKSSVLHMTYLRYLLAFQLEIRVGIWVWGVTYFEHVALLAPKAFDTRGTHGKMDLAELKYQERTLSHT